jgi:hypothetical protein
MRQQESSSGFDSVNAYFSRSGEGHITTGPWAGPWRGLKVNLNTRRHSQDERFASAWDLPEIGLPPAHRVECR